MKALTLAALAVSISACASSGGLPRPPAPFPDDNAGFVTTLGADTVALEVFTIRGNTLDAEVVARTPRTSVRRVTMSWDGAGRVTSYETRVRQPSDHRDSARAVTTFAFAADSISVTNASPARSQTSRMANGGVSTVLTLPAYSTLAVVARNALALGDTLMMVQFGNDALPYTVRLVSPGIYSMTAPMLGTVLVQLDALGRVHQIDGSKSPLGSFVQRVSTVNLPAWISDYAARDAAGTGLGPLSPADSVRAAVGNASVAINYQRPSKRGREIFGTVVPYGAVWRTGANSATSFTTSRDLMIGGVRVPAGAYTLWSVPNRDSWHLVVNQQTGQWGTDYNADRDLARIPMTVERLASPVEQFTIDIANGRLSLAWDGMRAWVPIAVAP